MYPPLIAIAPKTHIFRCKSSCKQLKALAAACLNGYLLHCRLAEILYTMGGHDNFLAARKYFSQSLHLKKSNPRALFGLAQCTQALSKTKLAKVDAEVNSAVHSYASEALQKACVLESELIRREEHVIGRLPYERLLQRGAPLLW